MDFWNLSLSEIKYKSTLLHGLVGYRALAVDYTQDSGTNKSNLDLILHGPVVGLSFRW